jgi:hypothetical protein
MRRKRVYATDTETQCRRRGSHHDGIDLVSYLMASGGKSDRTAAEICEDLGWWRRTGSSSRELDMGRFDRAKNHVKDGTRDGGPCTGFRVHYRTSARGNEWRLIDPSGSLADHREAARAEILGDIQTQVSYRTINGRRIVTAHSMADFCLAATPPDTYGYQLMMQYCVEIENFGAITDKTIAELTAYFA